MQWHELTDVVHHACAVHVWRYILSWIDADKSINKCLCLHLKHLNRCICNLRPCQKALLTTNSLFQRLCIWDTSSVSLRMSAILKLRKTTSFSGSVRVLHFSLFDSPHPESIAGYYHLFQYDLKHCQTYLFAMIKVMKLMHFVNGIMMS